jgi:hypothetical protein
MVARGLAGTEGSAHQLLMKLLGMMGPLGLCFVDAQAHTRAIAFMQPFEDALGGAKLPSFDEACLAEAESDGDEDTAFEAWRLNPTHENWSKYRRVALRDIARLTMKLRAGDAQYGAQQ